MKYLYTGLGLLALCLVGCLLTTALLDRHTQRAVETLTLAMETAEGGDYAAAAETVEAAAAYWRSHQGFFGITLRHDEADEINASFRALTRYATESSAEEFLPNCAELIARITHLSQMERPSYFNVLTGRLVAAKSG